MGKKPKGEKHGLLKTEVLGSGHYFYVLVSVTVLEATSSSIRKVIPD